MKKISLILFFVFSFWGGYAQFVHYGYPVEKQPLKKGVVVILNVPVFSMNHLNEFVNMEQIDSLVKFLEINDTNMLRIEINNFYGIDSDGYAAGCAYSNDKNKNENTILAPCTKGKELMNNALKNYYIVSKGDTNPLYCSEIKNFYYIMRNTRMEIVVE